MYWFKGLGQRRGLADAQGGRTYAVGDIHGRIDLFGELIALIGEDKAAFQPPSHVRLVVLGDFIDRGPASSQLIELFMRLTAETRATVLKGNHEAALVDAWRGNHDALDLWLGHGGHATLASFGVDCAGLDEDDSQAWMRLLRRVVPERAIAWLDALPLSIAADGHYFVHAGIRPGVPIGEQCDRDKLWIRDEFTTSPLDHGAIVVHGHTVEDGVAIRANRIGVDTGAYSTGRLSAVAIEGGRYRVITTGPRSPIVQPEMLVAG